MGGFFSSTYHTVGQHHVKEIKKLGEGGFSMVYLVEDTDTRERMALKSINVQTPEAMELAQKEISTFKEFMGPGLLPLIDSQVVEGDGSGSSLVLLLFPYYKMNLDTYVQKVLEGAMDPMGERQLLELFNEVIDALLIIHQHEPPYAHRDIKPANIMLTMEEEPVLIDFGSMAPWQKISSRKEAVHAQDDAAEHCTSIFRAPELFDVLSDCTLDGRVDVWSLGLTLYTVAYQEALCDGTHTSARAAHVPPHKEGERYTAHVKELVSYMLVVNPLNRPSLQDVKAKMMSILTASLANGAS